MLSWEVDCGLQAAARALAKPSVPGSGAKSGLAKLAQKLYVQLSTTD